MADTDEQPILWLGLAGFDAEQCSRLAEHLEGRPGGARWRVGPFAEADAWIINGARTQLLPGGTVNVHPGIPTQRITRLSLDDIAKPLGVASPVPAGLDTPFAFDLGPPPALETAIVALEQRLEPLRARLALAGEMIRRGARLRHGIHHVRRRGRLLAVINLRRGIAGLAPGLRANDLAGASWERQSASNEAVPPAFEAIPANQLSWLYALHSDASLLPPSYLHRLIYYRGTPRVPAPWLTDSQLALLQTLSSGAESFQGLHRRTGLPDEQLEKDLTCLYFASAITSTPSKAAHPSQVTRDDGGISVTPLAELLPMDGGDSAGRIPIPTVPLFADSFRTTQAPDTAGLA